MTRKPVTPGAGQRLFSLGHSNHPLAKVLGLLREHSIEVLADIRSVPRSRFSPHFNRPALQAALEEAGVRYEFLGQELGGRPKGDEYYDTEGHVLYGRLAESAPFIEGIRRVTEEARCSRIALLCSEEDPAGCHRRLLVGRVLARSGVEILHIRGDGGLHTEEDLQRAERPHSGTSQQALFTSADESKWRSVKPVARPRSQR